MIVVLPDPVGPVEEGRAADDEAQVAVARGAPQHRHGRDQPVDAHVAGQRQADHVEPLGPHPLQRLREVGLEARHHLPAGLGEEVGREGQAEGVGLAGGRDQQDAPARRIDRLRVEAESLQVVDEAAQPRHRGRHLHEVAGILLPEPADVPGGRRHEPHQHLLEGHPVVEQAADHRQRVAILRGQHLGGEVGDVVGVRQAAAETTRLALAAVGQHEARDDLGLDPLRKVVPPAQAPLRPAASSVEGSPVAEGPVTGLRSGVGRDA